MRRGLVLLISLGTLAAVGIAAGQALVTEEAVLAGSKNERNPALGTNAAVEDVLAFTRSRPGARNSYDAYAMEGANAAVKLNTAGQGWTGGIDFPVVSYQQISGGQSDIFFYDLDTDQRFEPEVNTPKWEWRPSVSGDVNNYTVLFGRDNLNSPTQRVLIHEHPAHVTTLVSIVTEASHFIQPDQLSGDFATFTRCAPVCNVYRRDIASPAPVNTRLPKPATRRPRHQYAGGVTPTGVVFLVRSGPRCGEQVRIVRYDLDGLGDPEFGTTIAALPRGKDVATAFARENADTSVTLVYDRVDCATGRFDIYKVEVP